jgi:GNAT superfamily N-acetyltransferase
MDNRFVLELVGYFASALIAISLMMSSIVRLRLINLIGAALFATYGLLIHAYPVAVLNGLIVLVNLWHLSRMWRAKEFFQLLPLKPESVYLPYFLEFYAREISQILPDFKYQPSANQLALFILRDCAPVGVFIAERRGDGGLQVLLDFVIPGYRDLKLGRYLFTEQAEFFRQQGVKEIVIAPRTREFGAYLVKVGFAPSDRRAGEFGIRFASRDK